MRRVVAAQLPAATLDLCVDMSPERTLNPAAAETEALEEIALRKHLNLLHRRSRFTAADVRKGWLRNIESQAGEQLNPKFNGAAGGYDPMKQHSMELRMDEFETRLQRTEVQLAQLNSGLVDMAALQRQVAELLADSKRTTPPQQLADSARPPFAGLQPPRSHNAPPQAPTRPTSAPSDRSLQHSATRLRPAPATKSRPAQALGQSASSGSLQEQAGRGSQAAATVAGQRVAQPEVKAIAKKPQKRPPSSGGPQSNVAHIVLPSSLAAAKAEADEKAAAEAKKGSRRTNCSKEEGRGGRIEEEEGGRGSGQESS
mmetsp:Transcript_149796/g.287009  ORF Transcript_149796/g.287009 Transcript_149796/m.287009 type:complete len:314 (+) Transcript_149796:68-1009(+)